MVAALVMAFSFAVACGDDDDDGGGAAAQPTLAPILSGGGNESSENGQIPGSRAAEGDQPLGTGEVDSSKSTITIPYLTFLTGPAAFVGESQKKGVDAFVNWINANGGINGHPVEVAYLDDQSDPSQTVNFYRQVADNDDYLVLASGGINQVSFKDLSDELKLPCVCLPGTSQLDTPVADYLFTSEATAQDFHQIVLKYAQEQGWKTVGLLRGENAYDDDWVSVFRQDGAKYGIEVIAEEQFALTDTTWVTQLTKLRDANADFLHIFVPNPAVWAEVEQLGIDTSKVTSDHPGTAPPILLAAGDAVVGIHATQPKGAVYKQALPPESPHYKQADIFAVEFAKVTQDPPDAFALFGWNIMHIISEALRRAEDDGQYNRDGVRDVLEAMNGDLVTAMGVIAFSATDHRALGETDFTIVEVGPNAEFTAVEGFY
jgi:branched-chain amino acid transport system substrate-binding protein